MDKLVLELKRNAFHLALGCALALMILSIEKTYSLVIFAAAIILGMILSELIVRGKKISVLDFFIRHFERENVRPGNGVLHFLTGAFISLAFFPKETVFVAVLILAFVDSFSTVFGTCYGRIKIRKNKTLEGFLAGFASCFIVTSFFIPLHVALVACLVASVVELYAFLDDNVLIPVATSLIIYLFAL
ncbi:MAG: hypothetical protein QXO69_02730 [archaeon]